VGTSDVGRRPTFYPLLIPTPDLPTLSIVEDPANDDADPIGLPELVIQDAVSSNEVQLSVAQFRAVAKDLAIFTYAVNHDLTEALS